MDFRSDARMMDFRSDTVTQPTPAMRQAMMEAPLGDDVFGDDPSVLQLQELAAQMLGFEDALFAPSGTQSNLIALISHCQRGDEAIVGQQSHTYRWEAGGMAVLGSIQPQPLEQRPDGTIALEDIEGAIKPNDPHHARTRLVALENTIGGKVLPLEYMRAVSELARRHGLRTHLDGARLFNAAVALCETEGGDPVGKAREICAGYDSLSFCLSKGLGAPVGSLLLGSKAFIQQARRTRKMLGGGMRQAGILAAAGTYALRQNVRRLAEDHTNAQLLAQGLKAAAREHPWLADQVNVHPAQTNMVFMDVKNAAAEKLLPHLAQHHVKVTSVALSIQGQPLKRVRWVTHLDTGRADVERALQVVTELSD